MATYYMDFEGGNDANAGTSFALRWKSITNGATAARIAPGDTIRIMASPPPSSTGMNATWTDNSQTVTLASAVTADICLCETTWTPSANVTVYTNSNPKQGVNRSAFAINAAFTTGLAAYFPTGTLNLSAYQQVSFWYYSYSTWSASQLSLRLCSDAAGVTSVHTIPIPACVSTFGWQCVTVDLGSALSSSIQSIALYLDADLGAIEMAFDNIMACKAPSAADCLTLHSLIGKPHTQPWQASTSYAVNDLRRPSAPNRTGFRYKVSAQTSATGSTEPTWPLQLGLTVTDGGVTWSCDGLEDTWYAIASLTGTTLTIDNGCASVATNRLPYAGSTETLPLFRREPIQTTPTTDNLQWVRKAGTALAPITFTGGWNRTDMSSQTDETWCTGSMGYGTAYYLGGFSYITLSHMNAVRFLQAFTGAGNYAKVQHGTFSHCTAALYIDKPTCLFNVQILHTSALGANHVGGSVLLNYAQVTCNSNFGDGIYIQSSSSNFATQVNTIANLTVRRNAAGSSAINSSAPYLHFTNLIAQGGSYGVNSSGMVDLVNPLVTGTAAAYNMTNLYSPTTAIRAHKNQQTAGAHLHTFSGGTISSATDQRHTSPGLSWKFQPTNSVRTAVHPLTLKVAKVAVNANALVTMSIWTRRSNTNIQGQLRVAGVQLLGVPTEVVVPCAPAINTWVQSGNLTFTPTESGVAEVEFSVWDGVGTSNSFWIDDFVVSQA